MNTNKDEEIGWFKRAAYSLIGRRKTIMLAGYTGSGKTTVLTVLSKRRNLTRDEVEKQTIGAVKKNIEYETKDHKKMYIKSVDMAGLPIVVNGQEFRKKIESHHYIIYMLNVERFVNGNNPHENNLCLAWLQKVNEIAKNNGKPMLLVLSHADEFLKSLREENPYANYATIRYLFLSDKGYLSKVNFNCETVVANVLKYEEVQSIIEIIIKK